ncbi:MAG: hypothetical protein ISS41_10885 [Candidatus Aminicenantes bacterium]|nr:hypothetical protein [Candidatus Aminicenantes bacterium]
MALPEEFLTTSTLFTLGGSATAVWIITSAIGCLFESQKIEKIKKWIGLILSLAIVLFGVTLVKEPTMLTWVVAVVNGFLVFLTVLGLNTVVSARLVREEMRRLHTRDARVDGKKTRGRFRERWL